MGRKSKYSYEVKCQIVLEYETGNYSMERLAVIYGVSYDCVRYWCDVYKSHGLEGLNTSHTNKHWSKEIKIQAVEDYMSGIGSLLEICKKYKISSHSILSNWIKVYNSGHKELKSSGSGGNRTMTKARKTTFDERVDIVKFCIANNKDYGLTVDKFNVSYQQIYLWVKKYENKGIDGLVDRRGKTKPESEMSEVEKLKLQNKMLEAEKMRLEMEVNVLKKLAEIERRRR